MKELVSIIFLFGALGVVFAQNFNGGNSDGFSSSDYNETLNIFAGGDADGFSSSDYNETLNIFAGGDADGFSTSNFSPFTYVPDNNFEQALIDLGYDDVLDDYVVTANINTVTFLNVSNQSIADLTGIEDFVALTNLQCQNNQLISLNVSANTLLTFFRCDDNSLTGLDVSANTVLTAFNCRNNQLNSLNVKNGNNTNFTFFNSALNPSLTCIDVDDVAYSTTNWLNIDIASSFSTNCNAAQTYVPDDNFEQALIDLGYDDVLDDYVVTANINTVAFLDVINEGITDLTGIEDFVALTNLQCQNNQLTSLDVSANTLLTFFRCDDNSLTGLDVSANTVLTAFNCRNNQLNSLNVKNGNNTNFTFFNSALNPSLTCIDVDDAAYSTTNWTNIDAQTSFSLDCNAAQTYVPDDNFEQALIDLGYDDVLDDYVVTANISSVISLNVSNRNIADLTGIEGFTALTELSCQINQLSNLNISLNTSLVSLHCASNQLTNLDVSSNQDLETLYCFGNQLTSLDVSNNPALFNLNCNANLLTSLDVSNNLSLEHLSCSSNQINNIDVSNNTALFNFNCNSNQLTSLDVSANTALTILRVDNNQLTSLDVKNGNNTNFTTFNTTNNPNLTCIEVDDAVYSTTNWTDIDAQTSFSEDCSAASIQLSAKVYLQGAATNPNSGEETWMRDDLRVASLIPTTSPYADALTCNASVFTPTGNNAIVDWVWVELRDENDNTNILASTSALLQRDGDVVSVDGVSALTFSQVSGNYFVVIKHRNHLGIMSASTIALSEITTLVGFSNGDVSTFGSNAQTISGLPIGVQGLWSGDVNGDNIVQYSGGLPDVPAVLSFVLNDAGNFLNLPTFSVTEYSNYDVDMDGISQYTGSNPEPPIILQNVLVYPSNFLNLITWPIEAQLPVNLGSFMQRRTAFINSKN